MTEKQAGGYNTPYDDVFRTLSVRCPELLIPLINEVFRTDYDYGEKVTLLQNEHFLLGERGQEKERITDGSILVDRFRKHYHFECQSTGDSSILIRIFEYDVQIALEHAQADRNELTVTFPHSAVLYLRGKHQKGHGDSEEHEYPEESKSPGESNHLRGHKYSEENKCPKDRKYPNGYGYPKGNKYPEEHKYFEGHKHPGHCGNTPEVMKIRLVTPDGEVSYDVKTFHAAQYPVEYLLEKNLLFLLPFHLFAFENRFPELNENAEERETLLKRYQGIREWLDEQCRRKKLDEFTKHTILNMTMRVADALAGKYQNVKKGVDSIMGGNVLSYEAADILDRGIERGLKRGLEQGLEHGIRIFIQDKLEDGIDRTAILNKLVTRYQLSEEKAEVYLSRYADEGSDSQPF